MRTAFETRLSPCLEWIFAEREQLADRFADAAASGFRFGEFWHWRARDMKEVEKSLSRNAIEVSAVVVDPPADIASPKAHAAWLRAVDDSAAVAEQLSCDILVATAGRRIDRAPGECEQLQTAAAALAKAAEIAGRHHVRIALEPLNNRVDHPGTLLTDSLTAGRLVSDIGSPALGILLDVYHSHAMGEDVAQVINALGPRIYHVQVADDPGRNEPGTGRIRWPEVLGALDAAGYDGPIGLEYKPTMPSAESARFAAHTLADAWKQSA